MIRTHQKCLDTSRQNQEKVRPRHWWAFRPIKLLLCFIEDLQRRSCEKMIKRISEEKVALRESQSKAVIARRPPTEDRISSN